MPVSSEEFVPQWAKHVVWYQIFPERFRNGDPSNDPALEDIIGAYPHDTTSPWKIHPWGSDWYKKQPWEMESGKDIWHNIYRRRYGGDLQGIIDKLDYLQELGVTALYLNPVFESPSLHKYDGASYHHIDPTFGPDPAGDRELMKQEIPHDPSTWVWTSADLLALKLINEVKKRGLRIIFDGVFNHMGINSFAFKDLKQNQQNSPYKDWFDVKSWDDPEKGTQFNYVGWFGVKDLPEIKEDENGIVSGPKEYIFAATERWMNPMGKGAEFGIDGWRLDVAFCVEHAFWKDWRQHVKALNPEAYITAEIIDPIPKLLPYLQGDEFDAVMNYNFGFTAADFFMPDYRPMSPSRFDSTLRELRNAFPPGVTDVMQNLFDSHDTNRLLSHIANRNRRQYRNWSDYFNWSKGSNPDYFVGKPSEYDKKVAKLMVMFQMTYPGAPMIYYGDEVGMWGANDPCDRKPMVWEDIEYEPEQVNPDGHFRTRPEPVEPDRDLFTWYQKLISIRNGNEVFRTGSFETVITHDKKKLYGYKRILGDVEALVILNNSTQAATQKLEGQWTDMITGQAVSGPLELDAKSGVVLMKGRL